MSVDDWKRLLERVTLRLPFKAGIGEIRCSSVSNEFTLDFWFTAPDSVTQVPGRFTSTRVLPHWVDDDRSMLGWVRAQWRAILEHELDESLLVDGKLLRDPRITVNDECPDHRGCRIAHVVFGPPTTYSCTTDATKRPAKRVWSEEEP